MVYKPHLILTHLNNPLGTAFRPLQGPLRRESRPAMKWLIRIAVLLAVLVAGLLWFGYSQIGRVIKYGIEKGGSQVLKVPVTVKKVSLSFMGTGSVDGLEFGNPEGFAGPRSVQIGHAEISLDTSSVSQDKVLIKSIRIADPAIFVEAGPGGGTNLKQIIANANAAPRVAPQTDPAPSGAFGAPPSKGTAKLQIDEIVITGAKLNASAGLIPGLSADVILPEIRLQSLGTGPEGISPAELTATILNRITEEAAKKGAGGSLKDLLKGGDVKVNTDLKKGIEGLGKLLK